MNTQQLKIKLAASLKKDAMKLIKKELKPLLNKMIKDASNLVQVFESDSKGIEVAS